MQCPVRDQRQHRNREPTTNANLKNGTALGLCQGETIDAYAT
jgi:hypothetical protein